MARTHKPPTLERGIRDDDMESECEGEREREIKRIRKREEERERRASKEGGKGRREREKERRQEETRGGRRGPLVCSRCSRDGIRERGCMLGIRRRGHYKEL